MTELEKAYDHVSVEDKIYKKWMESGFFSPDNLDGDPYTIIMPPPNVTGTLHIGHALGTTIQDILIRFERMRGKKTLWLPGTDHAAIATQAKVEADLYKKEKKTRFDFEREEFLKLVENFAQGSHDTIINQLKRLGASADWSKEAYTLDEQRTLAVKTAFKRMFEDGIIYRGARIVNWDPKLKTTVSDDEIEWKEEKAQFYYLKYGPFTIGTARPETKFGDKYVVMHPSDERYTKYKHGEKIEVEWINGPITATIIKDEAADMEFGTGVMTITPWHDATDFEIAQRHGLDKEQIIDERGCLLPIAAEFSGQHIKKARSAIIEKLQNKGLVEKIDENYVHRIATNSRGGGIIEPQIKEQWFVDVNREFEMKHSEIKGIKSGDMVTLKQLMRHVVQEGLIKIIPNHFEKIYFHWIDNLRDWCISRQIWYGHRIPVWYDKAGKQHLPKEKKIIFVRHGQSTGNEAHVYAGHLDHELTEKGINQAKETAKLLENIKFNKIFTSDLKRAKNTAEIISKHLDNRDLHVFEELREVFGGKVQGKPGDKDKGILIKALESNEGETADELIARAKKAWQIINDHGEDDVVVIVGHNSFLSVMKATQEGITTKEGLINFRRRWHIPNSGIYEFSILTDPLGENLNQDPDTLDTWFSSGLWTFSTLGWPNNSKDLQIFHPTDVLETGYDILFFWVARMILMSGYYLGQIPFKTVYLHGLVRDKDRQKMSKSKGNIIDPLGVIDTYGTDALRFALIFSTAAGNDIPLSEDKIKGMKHFANKLWNIARFVLSVIPDPIGNLENQDPRLRGDNKLTDADKDILAKLDALINSSTQHLENFRLHEAAQEIYQFTWYEFADVYIEASKKQLTDEKLKQNTLVTLHLSLVTILKLLHPFMPFVTEEIWDKLNQKDLLIISKWPN